jgi:hypothetical protein
LSATLSLIGFTESLFRGILCLIRPDSFPVPSSRELMVYAFDLYLKMAEAAGWRHRKFGEIPCIFPVS